MIGESLTPDRLLSNRIETNEMEAMEMRIEKMLNDKETIAKTLPTLNEYIRMRTKLRLCSQLLLDSANIVIDVKTCILDGKLFKAYENFIKYEKCRNDLLDIIENNTAMQQLIIAHFNDVELIAMEICDKIRLKLTSANHDSNRGTDNTNNNNHNDSDCISDDNMKQQIVKIIKYDTRLDDENEMRKGNGLKGLLNRPRNWKGLYMDMLNNPVQSFIDTSNNGNDGNDNGDVKELKIKHDTAYHEELLVMRKYFQEILLREANFCKAFEKFLEIENIAEQINNLITTSKLFAAIEKLLKTESIRYHILAFAKSHNEFDNINKLLMPYYEPIEQLYAKFINEAKYYCNRGIDIIRGKDPEPKKQLELILRAIEIDEKIDKLYDNNQFKITNRPHCWREMLFKIIEERVQQRLEAFEIEDRKLNQNWVTRNLEICRLYIVEDLYAAKHFLRILSKEHQLYNNFIIFYHNGIANKISELAKRELNKRELIQLLSWIRQYPGEHMLGMKFLEIDSIALIKDKPLLEQNELMRLFEMFVEIIKSETAKWALKTVEQEFTNIGNLQINIMEDQFGYYYTHLPHILYSIVNDQMTLACEISNDVVPCALNECLNEYIRLICPLLENSIVELKNQKERSEECIKIMIAIANNLDMFADSTDELKKYIERMTSESLHWNGIRNRKRISVISQSSNNSSISTEKQNCFNRKMQGAIHDAVNALRDIPATLANMTSSSSENILNEINDSSGNQLNDESETEIELEDEEPLKGAWERIEILKICFKEMLQTMMNMLCDEICNSVYNYFEQLLSKQWTKDPNIIGIICETIRDYENDCKHLKRNVHIGVLRHIEFKIVAEYLNAIASRKLTCTEYRKRCVIAKCLQNDVEAMRATFNPLFAELNYTDEVENLTNLLHSIAEFITLRDKSMVLLEMASLLRKYPEMTQEFLFTLTDIRDDITSSESRALIEECMKMIDRKDSNPVLIRLFQMAKGERKTSQVIKDVVPRIRRRVKVSIANQ